MILEGSFGLEQFKDWVSQGGDQRPCQKSLDWYGHPEVWTNTTRERWRENFLVPRAYPKHYRFLVSDFPSQ